MVLGQYKCTHVPSRDVIGWQPPFHALRYTSKAWVLWASDLGHLCLTHSCFSEQSLLSGPLSVWLAHYSLLPFPLSCFHGYHTYTPPLSLWHFTTVFASNSILVSTSQRTQSKVRGNAPWEGTKRQHWKEKGHIPFRASSMCNAVGEGRLPRLYCRLSSQDPLGHRKSYIIIWRIREAIPWCYMDRDTLWALSNFLPAIKRPNGKRSPVKWMRLSRVHAAP